MRGYEENMLTPEKRKIKEEILVGEKRNYWAKNYYRPEEFNTKVL